jgi:hypothetical protein
VVPLNEGSLIDSRSQFWQNRLRRKIVHGRDETVPSARERLYVSWVFGRVSERFTQPVHGCIQAMFKVDKRAFVPKVPLELIPTNHLTGTPEKRG